MVVMRNLIVFCLLCGCGSWRPPPVAVEPSDTDKCEGACSHLAKLKCPEAEPLADGTSCTQFCVETQKSGHALNPTCVLHINKCPEIEKCLQTRKVGD